MDPFLELADEIAAQHGLVILRRDDYDAARSASYIYLWVNFTRLEAGKEPFLYIGSRRFDGDPEEDNYQSSSELVKADIAKGDDLQRYILASFDEDDGEVAYSVEDAILKEIGVGSVGEFYNMSEDGAGFTPEGSKALWADPERREKASTTTKRSWQDPTSNQNTPETNKKRSIALKKSWQDQEVKKKRATGIKRSWADPTSNQNSPETKKKRATGVKRSWQDPNSKHHSPETKKKRSIASKKSWKDPNAKHHSPEVKAARSSSIKTDPWWQQHIEGYQKWIDEGCEGSPLDYYGDESDDDH